MPTSRKGVVLFSSMSNRYLGVNVVLSGFVLNLVSLTEFWSRLIL